MAFGRALADDNENVNDGVKTAGSSKRGGSTSANLAAMTDDSESDDETARVLAREALVAVPPSALSWDDEDDGDDAKEASRSSSRAHRGGWLARLGAPTGSAGAAARDLSAKERDAADHAERVQRTEAAHVLKRAARRHRTRMTRITRTVFSCLLLTLCAAAAATIAFCLLVVVESKFPELARGAPARVSTARVQGRARLAESLAFAVEFARNTGSSVSAFVSSSVSASAKALAKAAPARGTALVCFATRRLRSSWDAAGRTFEGILVREGQRRERYVLAEDMYKRVLES